MTYQLLQERGEVLITLCCFQTSWFNKPFPHVCSQIFTSSTFRCCLNRTVRRGIREHLTPLLFRPRHKGQTFRDALNSASYRYSAIHTYVCMAHICHTPAGDWWSQSACKCCGVFCCLCIYFKRNKRETVWVGSTAFTPYLDSALPLKSGTLWRSETTGTFLPILSSCQDPSSFHPCVRLTKRIP